jgi:hypothetical protein
MIVIWILGCVWERGRNRISQKIDFFSLKIKFFYVFELFWCADIKNDF